MLVKRKRLQHRHINTVFALGKAKTEQMKGRDKTMLQKKTKYRQEVNSE